MSAVPNGASKVVGLAELAGLRRGYRDDGSRVVLCHGCFDIVHPGHLRYLEFARGQGDILVVSLTSDDGIEKADGTKPVVPQELRAETLAALELVDHVVIATGATAEPVIVALEPDVYIKGHEYQDSTHPGFLKERNLVESQGGRVQFSSGEVVFSSTSLLEDAERALDRSGFGPTQRLAPACQRWGLDREGMVAMVREHFAGKRVVVVGDVINDRYIFCDPKGVASEAPVLTVRPREQVDYAGGAGVVAAHVQALGGQAQLLTTVGSDALSRAAVAQLEALGVEVHALPVQKRLPNKVRYLADAQKILKIDDADPCPLDSESERTLLSELGRVTGQGLDAAIVCDFGYGTVTGSLLTKALDRFRDRIPFWAADVSGARQSLLHARGVHLLTPTEQEARAILGDYEGSLPGVAQMLMSQLVTPHMIVTLGARGCVSFTPRENERSRWFSTRLRSEYLPAMSSGAVDPVGAGDAMLATATLAGACGASPAAVAYLGSAAASLAVARVGNHAISREALVQLLASRPELVDRLAA